MSSARKAQECALQIGCDGSPLIALYPRRGPVAFFIGKRGRDILLFKVLCGLGNDASTWQEPLVAAQCALLELGMPVEIGHTTAGVLVTQCLPVYQLSKAELSHQHHRAIALISKLHKLGDARLPAHKNWELRPFTLAHAFNELYNVRLRGLLSPKCCQQLLTRLQWIEASLRSHAWRYTPVLVHGEITNGSIVQLNGQLRFANWERARIDDPFLDIASFASHVGAARDQAMSYLEIYIKQSSAKLDTFVTERFLLHVATINILEYMRNLLSRNEVKSKYFRACVLEDESGLPLIPVVSRKSGDVPCSLKLQAALEKAHRFRSASLPERTDLVVLQDLHSHDFAFLRARTFGKSWHISVAIEDSSGKMQTATKIAFWAAKEGLGPPVLLGSGRGPFADILASEWLPSAVITDTMAASEETRHQIVLQLAKLHRKTVPTALAPAFEAQRRGAILLQESNSQTPEPHVRIWRRIVEYEVQVRSRTIAITHGNAIPRNMLSNTDGEILFVDWRAASLDEPFCDLARFLVAIKAFAPDANVAFRAYLARKPDQDTQHLFDLCMLAEELRALDMQREPWQAHHILLTDLLRFRMRAERLGVKLTE